MLVATGIDAVLGHDEEGEGTFYHIEGILDCKNAGTLALARVLAYQVGKDFAVGRGLEEGSVVLKVAAELLGIHYVSVVCDGEIAGVVVEEEGLDVLDSASACGGVTHVAYGHIARQALDVAAVENLCDKAFSLDSVEFAAIVTGHDSASFLASVLQGVKSVIHQIGGILNSVNAEYTTFFVDFAIERIHIPQKYGKNFIYCIKSTKFACENTHLI